NREFSESKDKNIRKWAPTVAKEFRCRKCALNHEVRDFVRAILLHVIDHLETDNKYLQFLRDSEIISEESYNELMKEESEEEEEEEEF
ncbi:MAG TPA: hypothetical protein VE619_02480, partial [Nitrososphaeraceae archaeon]|nr:hypothetical protein [Nitrososphaeraceae archaeon]